MVDADKKPNYILGISAYYHDSAAALLCDGRIIAASQEERFTRKKYDASFPRNSIEFCLMEAEISPADVRNVVFYDKPLVKFERILETYLVFAPKGVRLFLKSAVVWIKEKLFLRSTLTHELKKCGFDEKKMVLLFSEHHLSHAASAFYPSPFKDAAILTIDGVGEWATMTIAHGTGNTICMLKELRFPNSLGLLYSAFTYFLGFKVNSGEYKLMGLAPYGDPDSEETKKFYRIIMENLLTLHDDGSIVLNQKNFEYTVGLRMVNDSIWMELFGFPKRDPNDEFEAKHMNLALAIQKVTEEVVLKMAAHAKEITGSKNLCLAGGVALNCVSNALLYKSGIFEDIWIQPASGDAGGALGAAYAVAHMYSMDERVVEPKDAMKGSFLGPSFSSKEISRQLIEFAPVSEKFEISGQLAQKTAELIKDGNVVGWFQGRMEWGPRALGNRSILGDPRSDKMQKHINLKIKYRESFRPFAGSVLEEDISEFFEYDSLAPYMLLTAGILPSRRNKRPENYETFSLMEKLYHQRSDVPAITHVDYSCRLQSVSKNTNPRFHELISAFKDYTGYGMVINTSFNVRGEPIVCTPADAYRCFMSTEMDYLVIGDMLFDKKTQPVFNRAGTKIDSHALD